MEPMDKGAIVRTFDGMGCHGADLTAVSALELFGREGDWHTAVYASRVQSLEVWEINPAFEPALRRNLPSAKIRITDSIVEVARTQDRFGLIVVDNPQAVYAEGRYCEHFELFPTVFRIAQPRAIFLINVNLRPYGLEANRPWSERRRNFYGVAPHALAPEFVTSFYRALAAANGFETRWSFLVPRNSFISYLVFSVTKNH